MSKLSKADKQFVISQLRQDKVVYATEGVLVVLVSLLLIVLLGVSGILESFTIADFIFTIIPVIGLGYAAFVGFTNFKRCKKIKKLEKELGLDI